MSKQSKKKELKKEVDTLNVLTNRAEAALQRLAHAYGKDVDCERCRFTNNCCKVNINCEEKIYDWAYDVSKNK
jgi:hypothetical protein